MKINCYELSAEADADLETLFDYTKHEFGFQQAVNYLSGIEAVLQRLLYAPELGRSRPDIKPGLFSITEKAHVIFYRILRDKIRVVRVLHGSVDIPKQF